jgi:aminoglycoside phosphotransferase (APT) family kinase protein
MTDPKPTEPKSIIDGPRAVRAGEELDATRLRPWLVAHVAGLDPDGAIEILQFPSGHSNLTYLVRIGERELVLRRPPFGTKVKSAHDMGREFRVLSRLSAVYPPAPRPLGHCDDLEILGAPFYVMERLTGLIVRRDLPRGLLWSPELLRQVSLALVDNLATIHAVDWAGCGLGDLGKPEGYVRRQVEGWSKRYLDAQTDDIPDVQAAAAWLAARLPTSPAPTLIHNDYKFDNVVLDPAEPTRVVGVLDWEMSTIGDPLMDLGTALSYWVEAGDPPDVQALRFGPTTSPGAPSRRELAERYAARTGRDLAALPFYQAFALFKNAVVLQQIYYRYKHGFTKDERFAPLIMAVRVLARESLGAAERAPS